MQDRNSRSENCEFVCTWPTKLVLLFDMKDIYTTLSGSCVYRRLLTIADMQRDKYTLIYGGNNTVLCGPGTLKTGVTVI